MDSMSIITQVNKDDESVEVSPYTQAKRKYSSGFYITHLLPVHVARTARISCTVKFTFPAKFRLQRGDLSHFFWNSLNSCLHQTVFLWLIESMQPSIEHLILIEVGRFSYDVVNLLRREVSYLSLLLFIAVPGSISKKTKNRNIFSSFFCCFGAQSTAAGTPCTTVTHTNHNHNHNENSLSGEEKDSKVSYSALR